MADKAEDVVGAYRGSPTIGIEVDDSRLHIE